MQQIQIQTISPGSICGFISNPRQHSVQDMAPVEVWWSRCLWRHKDELDHINQVVLNGGWWWWKLALKTTFSFAVWCQHIAVNSNHSSNIHRSDKHWPGLNLCSYFIYHLALFISPQIHILESGEVRVFSRNQEDNTSKYPDIISRIPKVKTAEHTARGGGSAPGRQASGCEPRLSTDGFYSVRVTTAHVYLPHSVFSFCHFPLTHLSCVCSPCASHLKAICSFLLSPLQSPGPTASHSVVSFLMFTQVWTFWSNKLFNSKLRVSEDLPG